MKTNSEHVVKSSCRAGETDGLADREINDEASRLETGCVSDQRDSQEWHGGWQILERHAGFAVIENIETARYGALVPFKLAGVALNGCSTFNKPAAEITTNINRLLSKMLQEIGCNSSVEFIYGGGGGMDFSWIINGWIHDAPTADEAAISAGSLRQNLLMVLANEPEIRFEDGVAELQISEFNLNRGVSFEPQSIHIKIPQAGALGFTMEQANNTKDIQIILPRPSRIARSFSSVAGVVINSPTPVHLSVMLNRVSLTPEQQHQMAAALSWTRKHASDFHRQLAAQQIDISSAGVVESMLKRWVESAQGLKINYKVVSDETTLPSLLAIMGAEAVGNAVTEAHPKKKAATALSRRQENDCTIRLEGSLPAGATMPPLFPSVAVLKKAQVRRHYNHQFPDLDQRGLLLGSITESGIKSVHIDHTARSSPILLIGATGTGKSTLLVNMICQDICTGKSVALIDPHGDVCHQVVESLPQSRAKDVVLFNPSQSDFAPGLNVLECTGPNRNRQVNYAINELLKTFYRIYSDCPEAFGPMFELYFRNALLLLLESDLPDVTIMEVSLVFEDRAYRQFLLGRCKNPGVVGFWKEIAEKAGGESSLANIAPYITCKLTPFTFNATIRPIIGQARSTIDFRKIMDRKGVLLIKLPKGLLGEFDTQLLGSFILARIFGAAMSRADMPAHKRHPFHLYIDECQNFVNDSVASMLAEARKYGLCLTLANQNLSQLTIRNGKQNVLEAVLGNVGSLICFRVGAPDADKLRLYSEPEFGALDLQGLPNYHAVARIMTSRGPTRPFVFSTLPLNRNLRQKRIKPSVLASLERASTHSIAEVEAAIIERRNWAKNMGQNATVKTVQAENTVRTSAKGKDTEEERRKD